jgi:hypothetical protein
MNGFPSPSIFEYNIFLLKVYLVKSLKDSKIPKILKKNMPVASSASATGE